MTFFDEPPDGAVHVEPEPRRRRWRGVPEDTVGAPVSLVVMLAQTEELAVLASGFVAFPGGFSLSIVALSRLDPPREPGLLLLHGPLRRGREGWEERFVFGIGFSDGTKVTSMSWPPGPTNGEERVLRPQGGGSGGRRSNQRYWCEPLPSPGPMRLVCRWLAQGIDERAVEVDAGGILEAATKATAIWPDDVDLSEEAGEERASRGMAYRSYGARTVAAVADEGRDRPRG